MEILLTLSGFIFACFVALLYEYKIKQIQKKSKNKIRFFIMKGDINDDPYLYTKDIDGNYYLIADVDHLNKFGINASEYSEMPIEEVKEVFINLEN